MPAGQQYQPSHDDLQYNLLRKLLKGFADGVFSTGGGGGGGGGGAVTLAAGSVSPGAFSANAIGLGAIGFNSIANSAFAANSIAAGAIGFGALAPGAFSTGSIVAGVAADGWDLTQGTKADAAVTNPASSASLISLLKGLLTELTGSGVLSAVTSITNPVTVAQPTAANLNATVVQGTAANLNATVAIPDGANVTQGAIADGQAINSTGSWSAIALLKRIAGFYDGSSAGGTSLSVGDTLTHNALGSTVSSQANNSTGSWPVISLLKRVAGLLDGSLTTAGSNGIAISAVNSTVPVTGNVGGFTAVNKKNPTISTSAYSSGFNVGGILTLSNVIRASGGSGILDSIVVADAAAQAAPFTILIFDAALTGTATDHTAFTFNSADIPKIIAQVSVATSDYVTTSTAAVAAKTGLGIALKNNESGTNLYAVVVTTGTPTYTALALNFQFGILQD